MANIGKERLVSILCVGEILWDRFQDGAEALAGAPLNVAAALKRLGDQPTLISAFGADEDGQRALQQLGESGFTTQFMSKVEAARTGTAEIQLDARGNPSYTIARPAAFDYLSVADQDLEQLAALAPQWLYFGTLAQTSSQNEMLLHRLKDRFPRIACFYDLNLRPNHWDFSLVDNLTKLATILKLNRDEAELLFHMHSSEPFSLELFCIEWSRRYALACICITLGSEGCAVFSEGTLRTYPGFPATVVDTVGAGDAFAAGFLHGLQSGWAIDQITRFSNALGAIVASRATAIPDWSIEDVQKLLA
ncbi:carbohydrate kinase family protein [Acidobacterium capsulatum]|uniref:carbohydrate kinase family protein n=1 Tax=Acidobacterium capsulatum TaxID=33075 RepID=UPI00059EFE7B|nr:carbohydrate kinase [Acidobacterium capsulatum]